jgi:hypothetical protein
MRTEQIQNSVKSSVYKLMIGLKQELLNLLISAIQNFSSPCILVPKKSEPKIGKPINPMDSNRLVIGFRNLNKYTFKDNHPMPLISDLIDAIGPNKKYFTTLNCISGYLQIQMDENSKKYTAFATHDGLYQFRRLPYGLINSPSTFVRCVMNIFRDI